MASKPIETLGNISSTNDDDYKDSAVNPMEQKDDESWENEIKKMYKSDEIRIFKQQTVVISDMRQYLIRKAWKQHDLVYLWCQELNKWMVGMILASFKNEHKEEKLQVVYIGVGNDEYYYVDRWENVIQPYHV